MFQYAEEIFTLGREMLDGLRDAAPSRLPRVLVGIADEVPKTVSYRLLAPLGDGKDRVQVACREGKPEGLLADLALHWIDLVVRNSQAEPVDVTEAARNSARCSPITTVDNP